MSCSLVRDVRRTDYARIADTYDGGYKRREIAVDPHLEARVRRASGREVRVLDVACGTGTYLAVQRDAFADRGVALFGVDASEDMLRHARRKVPEATLAHGRAEALPHDDGAFDLVITSFAFHHFEDKERALDEMLRVLAPDGVLQIRNVAPEHMPGWWIYRWFPPTRAHDAQRFWEAERLYTALARRDAPPHLEVTVRLGMERLSVFHDEARRRDVSQLAILDDEAYEAGLRALRERLDDDPDAEEVATIALLSCVLRR